MTGLAGKVHFADEENFMASCKMLESDKLSHRSKEKVHKRTAVTQF